MKKEGQVDLPADAARVFFTIVTRESIAAADARVKELEAKLEKATLLHSQLKPFLREKGYKICFSCDKITERWKIFRVGVQCFCDKKKKAYCETCFEALPNKHKTLSCNSCIVAHPICALHQSNNIIQCDYDGGCDGMRSCGRSTGIECNICSGRFCSLHADVRRCQKCQDEMKSLTEKRKRQREGMKREKE